MASEESATDAPKKTITKKSKKSARNFRSTVHHMNSDINTYKAQEKEEEDRIAAENGTPADNEEDADGKKKKKKGKKCFSAMSHIFLMFLFVYCDAMA